MSNIITIKKKQLPEFLCMGLFNVDEPWLHKDRHVNIHTFIYVLEGAFHVNDDNIDYSLIKNQILFLKKDSVQKSSLPIPAGSRWYWITFKDNPLICEDKKKSTEKYVLPKTLHFAKSNNILQLLPKVHSMFKSKCFYKQDRLDGYLYEILYECLAFSCQSSEKSQSSDTYIAPKVIQILYEHLEEKFDTKKIEKGMGLNYTYIGRCFKKETGKSIQETFMTMKIELAMQLFQNTSLNISEISNQLNYPNPYYFSRVFKQVSGLSPKAYRQQMYW